MKVNAISTVQAMTGLQSDEILKVQKENGETSLVTIKKGSLSFCQKFWSWLGCGDTSFNKVLKVIAQIQKDNEAQLKGKDFGVLKGKIKKYNPLFGSKIKKVVQAKLSSSTSPTPSPTSIPVTKKTSTLSSEKCAQLIRMLKQGELEKVSAELTSEEQHLEFDQIVFDLCNDQNGWGADRVAFDESLLDQQKWKRLFEKKSFEAFDPFLQTSLFISEGGGLLVGIIAKQLELLEKNNASWSQKLIRLDLCLRSFYTSFSSHRVDPSSSKELPQSDEELQQQKQVAQKLIQTLKKFGELEKASTLEAIAPVLGRKEPKLSESQARALEHALLRMFIRRREEGNEIGSYGNFIVERAPRLVEQRASSQFFSSKENPPRWTVLSQAITRESDFASYKKLLHTSRDKELIALVEKEEYGRLCEKSFSVDDRYSYRRRGGGALEEEDGLSRETKGTSNPFSALIEASRKLAKKEKEFVQRQLSQCCAGGQFREILRRGQLFDGFSSVDGPFLNEKEMATFWHLLPLAEFGAVAAIRYVLDGRALFTQEERRKFIGLVEKMSLDASLQESFASYQKDGGDAATKKTAQKYGELLVRNGQGHGRYRFARRDQQDLKELCDLVKYGYEGGVLALIQGKACKSLTKSQLVVAIEEVSGRLTESTKEAFETYKAKGSVASY